MIKLAAMLLSKRSILPALGVASLLAGSIGCSTPAYSSKERGQMIARNMGMEWKMLQDDVDEALLLRPMTNLSRWNIR